MFSIGWLSEKTRLQAEAKAAEEARRKAEAEAAAEAKRQRELEREAARQALQKVTVDINEFIWWKEAITLLQMQHKLIHLLSWCTYRWKRLWISMETVSLWKI